MLVGRARAEAANEMATKSFVKCIVVSVGVKVKRECQMMGKTVRVRGKAMSNCDLDRADENVCCR